MLIVRFRDMYAQIIEIHQGPVSAHAPHERILSGEQAALRSSQWIEPLRHGLSCFSGARADQMRALFAHHRGGGDQAQQGARALAMGLRQGAYTAVIVGEPMASAPVAVPATISTSVSASAPASGLASAAPPVWLAALVTSTKRMVGLTTTKPAVSRTPSAAPPATADPAPTPPPPPVAKAQEEPPVKPRKVLKVAWKEAEGWCADNVHFQGSTENFEDGDALLVSITPDKAKSPLKEMPVRVRGNAFSGYWTIEEMLPTEDAQQHLHDTPLIIAADDVKGAQALNGRCVLEVPKQTVKHTSGTYTLWMQDGVIHVHDEIVYAIGNSGDFLDMTDVADLPAGGDLSGLPKFRWCKMDEEAGKWQIWNGQAWVAPPVGFVYEAKKQYSKGLIKTGDSWTSTNGQLQWPDPKPAWTPLAADINAKLDQWSQAVRDVWSKRSFLKRKGCTSLVDACCRHAIVVDVTFRKAADPTAASVVIAEESGRANDGLFFYDESSQRVIAHEVGHHLENPDEYADAVPAHLDRTYPDGDGLINGVDETSIMGSSLGPAKMRHFRFIAGRIQNGINQAYSKTFTYLITT